MPKTIKTISDLQPDDRNANVGTARGAEMITDSLRDYGAGRSILIDKHGNIIAGNKTVEGASAIGLDNLIVVQTDGTKLVAVQRTDLDINSPEARALAIADNRAGQVSLQWDAEVLASLSEEVDLSKFWNETELEALIQANETAFEANAPDGFKQYDESIDTDYECPSCHYKWSGQPK